MSELWTSGRRPDGAASFIGGNGNVRHVIRPKGKGQGSISFAPEKRRYQIFGTYGCAQTQQLLMLRRANGLRRIVGFVSVEPALDVDGWHIKGQRGKRVALADLTYGRSRQNVLGRPVLPMLWDRQRQLVVSNNVHDIIISLDEGFAQCARKKSDLRPDTQKKRIDELTGFINKNLSNNLCKMAFGGADEACDRTIHATLAMFELQLSERPFLLGGKMTFADLALATVVARFQYTNISSPSADLAQYPVVAEFERRIRQCAEFKRTWHRQSVESHFRDSVFSVSPPAVSSRGWLNSDVWFNRTG